MNESAALQPRIRQLLRSEYEIMTSLRMPGIVQAIDFGEVGNRPYLAMEVAEGQNLETLIGKKVLGEKRSNYAYQTSCYTLHNIHEMVDYPPRISNLPISSLRVMVALCSSILAQRSISTAMSMTAKMLFLVRLHFYPRRTDS